MCVTGAPAMKIVAAARVTDRLEMGPDQLTIRAAKGVEKEVVFETGMAVGGH